VSDTPRTDAVEAVCLFVGVGDIDGAVDELVEHARTLERENAQLREALRELVTTVDPWDESQHKYPKLEQYFIAPLRKARAALEAK
jgi:regulator of replication initiation timing